MNLSPSLVPYLLFFGLVAVPVGILLVIGLSVGYHRMDNPKYELKNGKYVKREKVDKIEITIEYVNKDKDKDAIKESEESQSPE